MNIQPKGIYVGVPSNLTFTPRHQVLSFPPTRAICLPILGAALASKCIPSPAQSNQSLCAAPITLQGSLCCIFHIKIHYPLILH